MSDHIDTSGDTPVLEDEPRLTVLNVYDAVEAKSVKEVVEMWSLDHEQVEAALAYHDEHEEEMEQIRERLEQSLKTATRDE
ncbi:hypothetical protein [Haloarcula litorea]|uniref:hypothetical protein n=1 Tax=Haloarcula litorea TaxID=3032579 RepID=UPI0023E7E554|nr:hypothetical protein [Halomicroarcula sp. GDY20]